MSVDHDSDVTERLRDAVNWYGCDPGVPMSIVDVCAEAATLIDQLRHRLALQDRRIQLLHEVAHRTWHLMDDSGEMDDPSDYMHDAVDHQRVSDALDALEADGWTPHDV